jgi:hypothetical protein
MSAPKQDRPEDIATWLTAELVLNSRSQQNATPRREKTE